MLASFWHGARSLPGVLFRQLFDADSSTYTYLLADERTREAILIDPVLDQVERDLELVRELELRLAYVLDTHVHADHVTGAARLRERSGARTVASRDGAPCADVAVGDGDVVRVGSVVLTVLPTPGHTNDSVSYRTDDRIYTGDALLWSTPRTTIAAAW